MNHVLRLAVAVCVLALLLLSGCVGSHEPTSASGLASSFESEFGIRPPPNVSDISSKTQRIGDTWSKWMRFRGDEAVFSQITGKGFQPCEGASLEGSILVWSQSPSTKSPNAPSWWIPAAGLSGAFYKSNFRRDFHASYHAIWRDPRSGFIYSKSGAWD